jgi:hypothetical protein
MQSMPAPPTDGWNIWLTLAISPAEQKKQAAASRQLITNKLRRTQELHFARDVTIPVAVQGRGGPCVYCTEPTVFLALAVMNIA